MNTITIFITNIIIIIITSRDWSAVYRRAWLQ